MNAVIFIRRALALFLVAMISFHLSASEATEKADPKNHIIRANRECLVIHPLTGEPFLRAGDFAAYMDDIFARAEAFGRERSGTNPPVVKLFVHVHGGLNGFDDTQKRMELVPLMMRETND